MYKKSLCLFADILGMKNLVNKKKAEEIKETINLFAMPFKSQILDNVAHNTSDKFDLSDFSKKRKNLSRDENEMITKVDELDGKRKCTIFSDSVFTTVDLSCEKNIPTIIYEELERLHQNTLLLIKRGIMFRGGITILDIYHEDNIIFGPGIIKSYEIESKYAQFPRLCIDSEVIEIMKKDDSLEDFIDIYTEDFDGMYYLNYLLYSINSWYRYRKDNTEINIVNETELDDVLSSHRDFIFEVEEYSNEIFTKYSWLKKYHNRTIRDNGSKLKEYNIDVNNYLIS